MAIYLNNSSRILVQGITGAEGTKHTNRMLATGTNIVAGVTPGKGGQSVDAQGRSIPVFGSVGEAVDATGADVSVVFVPPKFAKAAVIETIDAGVALCVIITEGIPIHDTANFDQYYKVLTLGDNQYPDGKYSDFLASYHPHWGRLGAKIAPTMGNHDAGGGGQGYYDYFNGVGVSDGVAGKRGDGWYSYDTGDSPTSGWHIVALNSECVGKECGTRQLAWLQKDLAASTKPCTVAYLHKPRFSSGSHGDDSSMQPFWNLLNQYKAEMMVAGHDHTYERQAPRNAAGARDDANGVRQFVAGTGGKSLYSVGKGPYTEASNGKTYGYLELTLRANSYDWRFIPSNNPGNGTFTDSGSANCH